MEEERWGQRTNHKRDNPANHKRRRRRQPRAPEGEGEGEGSGREGEGERGRGRRRRRWRQRERGRGNAVVARTPTSNMSVKEGGESVREASERRKFTILISINNRRRRKFSRQLCGWFDFMREFDPEPTITAKHHKENGIGYLRARSAIPSARIVVSSYRGIWIHDSWQAIHPCTEAEFIVRWRLARGFCDCELFPVGRRWHPSGLIRTCPFKATAGRCHGSVCGSTRPWVEQRFGEASFFLLCWLLEPGGRGGGSARSLNWDCLPFAN